LAQNKGLDLFAADNMTFPCAEQVIFLQVFYVLGIGYVSAGRRGGAPPWTPTLPPLLNQNPARRGRKYSDGNSTYAKLDQRRHTLRTPCHKSIAQFLGCHLKGFSSLPKFARVFCLTDSHGNPSEGDRTHSLFPILCM
jgi:hypothetical protein